MKQNDELKSKVIKLRERVVEALKNGIIQENGSEEDYIVADAVKGLQSSKPMKPKYRELADNGGLMSIECPQCQECFGLSIKFLDENSGVLIHFTCPYCQFEGSINER